MVAVSLGDVEVTADEVEEVLRVLLLLWGLTLLELRDIDGTTEVLLLLLVADFVFDAVVESLCSPASSSSSSAFLASTTSRTGIACLKDRNGKNYC